MRMKNTTRKVIMDSIMVLLMVMLYKKQAISMSFHEIGGLTFLGFILIHVILNHKWVTAATRKIFTKGTAPRLRVMYLDDLLLLIDFIFVGISAVMISHVVFHFNAEGMTFKAMHYCGAALALVLIGIHLGLHANLYSAAVGKRLPASSRTVKTIGVVICAALVIFGIYSIGTTSFMRWLSMPFSSGSAAGGPEMMQQAAGAATQAAGAAAQAAGAATQAAGAAAQAAGQGMPAGAMNHGAQPFSFATLLLTILQFFSITWVFAVLTRLIDKLVTSGKKH